MTLILSFSIHPFIFSSQLLLRSRSWLLLEASTERGGGRVTPGTSCQVITGPPHMATFTLALTPVANLEAQVGLMCMSLGCKLKEDLSSRQPSVVSIQTRKSSLCSTCRADVCDQEGSRFKGNKGKKNPPTNKNIIKWPFLA